LSKRTSLVKKIDTIHSKLIRLKGGNRCVVCGSTDRPTCGHLFSRDTYSTRWDTHDEGNAYVQCWGCNYSHEYNPAPFTAWYIRKYGLDSYEKLSARRISKPWKDWELEEIYQKLKEEYDSLVVDN